MQQHNEMPCATQSTVGCEGWRTYTERYHCNKGSVLQVWLYYGNEEGASGERRELSKRPSQGTNLASYLPADSIDVRSPREVAVNCHPKQTYFTDKIQFRYPHTCKTILQFSHPVSSDGGRIRIVTVFIAFICKPRVLRALSRTPRTFDTVSQASAALQEAVRVKSSANEGRDAPRSSASLAGSVT